MAASEEESGRSPSDRGVLYPAGPGRSGRSASRQILPVRTSSGAGAIVEGAGSPQMDPVVARRVPAALEPGTWLPRSRYARAISSAIWRDKVRGDQYTRRDDQAP